MSSGRARELLHGRLAAPHWFARRCARVASTLALGINLVGCGRVEDKVFEAALFSLASEPVSVPESAGAEVVNVRLLAPVAEDVQATFEVRGIEAQDDCQTPDFEGVQGTLTFSAGSDQASIDIWIGQDSLAETDERLEVVLSEASGATLVGPNSIIIVIQDDDRDGLVQAADHGVIAGSPDDQTEALQRALDAAGDLGRGVVVVPPGDYEVRSLEMTPGTTLSGRGARFLRPQASEVGTRSLRLRHVGPANSAPTLIEGVSLDGRRELQGPYQEYERQDDHLIMLDAASEQAGRLVVTVESVRVSSGTGDGVAIGPNSDASLCHIQAEDIWRDAIALHGGRSNLKLRGFDATASEGTSGIWLDGFILGYEDNRRVDVEIEDARLSTGDVEMDLVDGSSVVLRRLSMTEPPFRVRAQDSNVEVVDSVIQIGVPSDRHNNFTFAHNVRLIRSTIVSSERLDEQALSDELEREFSTLSVRWTAPPDIVDPLPGVHVLSVEGCRFVLGDDIEASDTVYAVDNPMPGGSVLVRDSALGDGFADWFAPGCTDCEVVP